MTDLRRIAVLDDYQQVAAGLADWDSLPGDPQITFLDHHLPDRDAVTRALSGHDVVVAMRERTRFDAETLRALPDLRLLVTTGPRNAAIDVDAAREASITVVGTSGAGTSATVEHTWALILALLRHVPTEEENIRSGSWQSTIGMDLAGRRLGLVGLGRIGSRVARIAQAFEMEVVAWSQNLQADRAAKVGVAAVSKEELLRTSDVVSMHVQLSERTRGLIGPDDIALLRPTAVVVNTSRGPIIDEAALLDALHAGRIAGAAIDVFEQEPLPADSPWRSAPRTVLTPHVGYVTEQTYRGWYADVVEDIAAWASDEPIRVIS